MSDDLVSRVFDLLSQASTAAHSYPYRSHHGEYTGRSCDNLFSYVLGQYKAVKEYTVS